MKFQIREDDLHPHLKSRMEQRGVSQEEIEATLNDGFDADDAKEGTFGKTRVFLYNKEWEGKFFEEKQITVYYKRKNEEIILLTAKARYGKFSKGEGK